jgi:alkylresorcinol/alkylpyrone synthase
MFPLEGRRLEAAMSYFDTSEVHSRYSVLSLSEMTRRRTLTETMALYAEHAQRLAQRAALECLARANLPGARIDLVIAVSCTGIMMPSLDAHLMGPLALRPDVRRLPITELGCVGGAAAVSRAHDYLVGHPDGVVLVIAVELPSLNFQPLDVTPDNLISSALFGDGAVAVAMTGDRVAAATGARGGAVAERGTGGRIPPVQVLGTHCHTLPSSTHALGFDLRDDGFHTVLSREIPALLRGVAVDLFQKLAAKGEATLRDIQAFVLHPGGKRILAAVQEALGLEPADAQPSWDVLREFGNQSSASVLFVLERWMTRRPPPTGTLGAMAAFGPGLTAESVLLRWT